MSRPRKHPLPSIEELRRRFSYDPESGIIRTREREGHDALSLAYNRRYANKPIGCLMNVGYWWIKVGKCCHLGHRIAWALHYGAWPDGELDHRDGNKLNNAITNLRRSNRVQNSVNSRRSGGASIYKGVTRAKDRKKWRCYIKSAGQSIYLGTFAREEDAAEAYMRAAQEIQGEFAFNPMGRIRSAITISMAT